MTISDSYITADVCDLTSWGGGGGGERSEWYLFEKHSNVNLW